jgi:hypothetical protein
VSSSLPPPCHLHHLTFLCLHKPLPQVSVAYRAQTRPKAILYGRCRFFFNARLPPPPLEATSIHPSYYFSVCVENPAYGYHTSPTALGYPPPSITTRLLFSPAPGCTFPNSNIPCSRFPLSARYPFLLFSLPRFHGLSPLRFGTGCVKHLLPCGLFAYTIRTYLPSPSRPVLEVTLHFPHFLVS